LLGVEEDGEMGSRAKKITKYENDLEENTNKRKRNISFKERNLDVKLETCVSFAGSFDS